MNTAASWPTPEVAKVLRIQTKLHQWATDDPNRRFDDLYNLVHDPAVLVDAWTRVRSNRGARSAGVDGRTAHHIKAVVGELAFLSELRDDLKARRFRPEAVREVMIPKPGGKRRRLGIATVRDRVVEGDITACLDEISHVGVLDRLRARHPPSASACPNGRLEGVNRRIRLISHRSFGFHSAAPLIALVYLCCAGIVIDLPR